MNPSAAADPLLALVAHSGLLSADQLAPFAAGDGPPPSRDALAARLVADKLLTPYQARMLLNGWYRGFFIADKFKILDSLGEGGMGRVFLCEQLLLERLVAVKQLQVGAGRGEALDLQLVDPAHELAVRALAQAGGAVGGVRCDVAVQQHDVVLGELRAQRFDGAAAVQGVEHRHPVHGCTEITVRGSLGPAKFSGTDREVRAGFQAIEVVIQVRSNASAEQLEKLRSEVEARCPVTDNLVNTTPVSLTLRAG